MGNQRSLEIDSLHKRYGENVALEDMTFSVHSGEIFGFVGGNGAGKTTTMRIALGVLMADSGSVRWAGREMDLSSWRRVGYMPEERGLYPKMKVGEQLQYLAELHGLSKAEAKKAVLAWTERLGVQARLNDELQKLSLGNQQRVQLAAALVHDPDVLVLDEPFSGLDPLAVDVMSAVLRQQSEAGVPVLFSSHQLDLVERLCDRVGIVNKGQMVAAGSVDELKQSGESKLLVDVHGAPTDWSQSFNELISPSDSASQTATLFDIGPGPDAQRILSAAMNAGEVREFSFRRPSLAELFRNVVVDKQTTSDDSGARS